MPNNIIKKGLKLYNDEFELEFQFHLNFTCFQKDETTTHYWGNLQSSMILPHYVVS